MHEVFAGVVLPEVEFRFHVAGGEADGWRPVHLHLSEGLSRLYECSLLLAHPLPAPAVDALFERHVEVEVSRGAGGRRVCGLVRRVEQLGTTGAHCFVRLVVVPELWALSLRQNSRIWQDLPVVAIVREVLRDAGAYLDDGALDAAAPLLALPAREYCVQYRESDLAFVLRLLEEEGIAFYFLHDGPRETLVLADREHRWPAVPTMDGGAIAVMDEGANTASVEGVQWLDAHRQMRPTGAVLRDYDFTHPDATLDMTRSSPGDGGSRAVYDYPAAFTLGPYNVGARAYEGHHGAAWARTRAEALRADADTSHGRSNVAGMSPGMRFTLSGHTREQHHGSQLVVSVEHHGVAWGDLSDDLRGSEHFKAILRDVGDAFERDGSGAAAAGARYWNRFVCATADLPWRPPRVTPRPSIPGPQTALVTAEPGSNEEICVDAHGRVLVRFHWERPEQRTASQHPKRSSCWVRVAQSWAGAAWGTMFIPRVGMEAVVHFLEGDPDRPLVTGCVYNGKNHAPYELPLHKTRSALKTLSSPGGDGYNELRFEDLKGQEQVWLHAQRDHDVMVRHDATVTVGHDRTQTVHHDEQLTVFNNRAAAVHRNDSLEVEGDRSVMVHGGGGLSLQVDGRYRLNADAGVLITCGASSIEMLPDRITLSSKTVNVVGQSLVNINGTLVKINCDSAPMPSKGDGAAPTAVKALTLMCEAGGALDRARAMVDPAQLAGVFAKGVDAQFAKLGAPQRVRERVSGLAREVAGELISSAKQGRGADGARLVERAVASAAGIATGGVFRPLAQLPAVRRSRVLAGLVEEAHATATDAATCGVMHAAGLHEGMAKDPFWQALEGRHGAEWKSFLTDNAMEAARQYVHSYARRHGASPVVQRAGDLMMLGAEKGVGAGIDAWLKSGRH